MELSQNRKELMQQKAVFISCVVPVHNEKENLKKFISALHDTLQNLSKEFEIIVVDDGSKDKGCEEIISMAKEHSTKILTFSRNFGKEAALTAGLLHARGDVAILLDADFQHPLEVIPLFLEHWSKGYDMVYGVRNNRDDESPVKRFFGEVFYKLVDRITPISIPANAGDFRLLDRKVVNALNSLSERERFMKGLYAWVGFNSIAVPFDVKEREAGTSSWRFKTLFELAITGITSFSNMPLRVWSYVGCIISFVSFVYALCIVSDTLIWGVDLPGFATITVAIMFFGGIQLLSIGILGEYIARIFSEVKGRPSYIIEKRIGFDDDEA